jgi:Recombination endonuclease VII
MPSTDPAKRRAQAKKCREGKLKAYRARERKYYADNAEKLRKKAAARWKQMPVALRKSRNRKARLKRDFGISVCQWDALFEAQGHRCACCSTTDPRSKNGWELDHDHVTKGIRGILCKPCNRLLGMLGDQLADVASRSEQLLTYLRSR